MSEQNIRSIVVDFTTDLTTVFPEYAFLWQRWLTADDAEYEKLNEHFLSVFPERFFDITNSNAEIFAAESTVNTMFLPDVDFKLLFNCAGVSENTKTSMWKYLQLLLFTVIGSVKDSSNFGDAMKMFESMDENDLQSKMQETMDGLGDFFKGFATEGTNDGSEEGAANEGPNHDGSNDDGSKEGTDTKGFKLPKPEVLHEHMRTLMEGKLGKLAKELTEEFTEDLKGVFDETDQNMSMKDIMAQIMKDPKKIMHIMKKITDKLQNKMKNGDISQDELMKEVAGLVEKFKCMGGGDDFVKNFASGPFAKMFKNMAGQAMGNQSMGNQNLSKHSAMKDRLRKKMEDKKQKQATASASVEPSLPLRPSSIVVKIGDEKQEKSGLAPPPAALSEEELVALFKTKNKKGKKSKN